MTARDTPGVIAPPPLVFLGFLAAVLTLDALWPLPLRPASLDPRIGWTAGAVLIFVGLVVFVLGVCNFARAGTPVPTRAPSRVLVTTGINAVSRNPIYTAMFLIYLGAGVLANSAWVIALFVPLALIIRYGVVAREEIYLERKFGDDYRAYKARVRRWF